MERKLYNMSDTLYLGSSSKARQNLLHYAKIPFKIIPHQSDENISAQDMDLSSLVMAIAISKMDSITWPITNADFFALTADTLIKDPRSNKILAKPKDKNEAISMLRLEQMGPIEVASGVVIAKFTYNNGFIDKVIQKQIISISIIEFLVDNNSIDNYLHHLPIALNCAGAGVIEDHGLCYLKSIQGSYSGAMGLPLFEVRMALKELGFKLM